MAIWIIGRLMMIAWFFAALLIAPLSELDRLRPFLEPFLKSGDVEVRGTAQALDKHFKGELDFKEWQRDRMESEKK